MSNEVLDLLKKNFDYLPPYLTAPTPTTVVARDSDAVPAASTSTVATGAQMPTAAQTSAGARMSTSATSNYQPAERPSEKVQVEITSEPAGADIYLDDAFVGSTPSKVPIGPGDHTVRVGRASFKE